MLVKECDMTFNGGLKGFHSLSKGGHSQKSLIAGPQSAYCCSPDTITA